MPDPLHPDAIIPYSQEIFIEENSPWVEGVPAFDPEKLVDAVQRCVEAMMLINVFEATDESILANVFDGTLVPKRVYPAGYVEELINDIKIALQGGEDSVDAEAHED